MEIGPLSLRFEIQGVKVNLDSCGFIVSSYFRAYYVRACMCVCVHAHFWSVIISGFVLNQYSHFNTVEIFLFLPAIH